MDLHDFINVQKMFQTMAADWGCPVWAVKEIVRQSIDESWEKAMRDSKARALWNRYFPNGKPTPDQYMLRLGHAHERGEKMPYLLK